MQIQPSEKGNATSIIPSTENVASKATPSSAILQKKVLSQTAEKPEGDLVSQSQKIGTLGGKLGASSLRLSASAEEITAAEDRKESLNSTPSATSLENLDSSRASDLRLSDLKSPSSDDEPMPFNDSPKPIPFDDEPMPFNDSPKPIAFEDGISGKDEKEMASASSDGEMEPLKNPPEPIPFKTAHSAGKSSIRQQHWDDLLSSNSRKPLNRPKPSLHRRAAVSLPSLSGKSPTISERKSVAAEIKIPERKTAEAQSEANAVSIAKKTPTFSSETIWQVDNPHIFSEILPRVLERVDKPVAERFRGKIQELSRSPLLQSAASLPENLRGRLNAPGENTIILMEPAIQLLEETLSADLSERTAKAFLAPLRERKASITASDLVENS